MSEACHWAHFLVAETADCFAFLPIRMFLGSGRAHWATFPGHRCLVSRAQVSSLFHVLHRGWGVKTWMMICPQDLHALGDLGSHELRLVGLSPAWVSEWQYRGEQDPPPNPANQEIYSELYEINLLMLKHLNFGVYLLKQLALPCLIHALK